MPIEAWARQFGLSDSDFQKYLVEHGSTEAVLYWCLANGLIAEESYLTWAAETYKLPLVSEAFFAAPVDPVFWDSVKSRFTWTSQFLPLAQWQDVLFIGCLQPRTEDFVGKQVQFVLAPTLNLAQLWARFQPAPQTIPQAAVESASAEDALTVFASDDHLDGSNVNLVSDTVYASQEEASSPTDLSDAPDGFSSTGVQLVSFDEAYEPEKQNEASAESAVEEDEPALELPDGVLLTSEPDQAVASLDFSSLMRSLDMPPQTSAPQTNVPPKTHPKPSSSLPPDPPVASVASMASVASVASAATPPAAPMASEATTPPQVSLKPTAPPVVPPTPPPVLENDDLSRTDALPSLDAISRTTSLSSVQTVRPMASVQPIRPPEAPPVAAPQASESRKIVHQVASEVEKSATFADLAETTLLRIMKHFEHGMILTFKKGQLRPWKWSELLLSVQGEKPEPIVLSEPNIFRIVHRTCLPYHGYVVRNTVNDLFFTRFHRGLTPKHVTIVPLMIGNQIAGMLMGMTNQEVSYKSSLAEMEALAKQVATAMERLQTQNASAA